MEKIQTSTEVIISPVATSFAMKTRDNSAADDMLRIIV